MVMDLFTSIIISIIISSYVSWVFSRIMLFYKVVDHVIATMSSISYEAEFEFVFNTNDCSLDFENSRILTGEPKEIFEFNGFFDSSTGKKVEKESKINKRNLSNSSVGFFDYVVNEKTLVQAGRCGQPDLYAAIGVIIVRMSWLFENINKYIHSTKDGQKFKGVIRDTYESMYNEAVKASKPFYLYFLLPSKIVKFIEGVK